MTFLRIPLLLSCLTSPVFAASSVPAIPPALKAEASSVAPTPPSSTAQQLYASAQSDLLQLRVLLKNGRSQSAVGSGFLIGKSNLVITNFHVVSQIALEPDNYFGEFKDTQGKSGDIELLAVDVQHDLAVVRVNRNGTGVFNLTETPATLYQGEHLYSLGNPLDLGFFISEGTYNGVSHRGFTDQIMFTGPVNPGMSGGPNVTATGEVAGVNVAHRRDGELVSFLVPATYAQKLFASITPESKPPKDFKPIIGEQLLAHQTLMMNTLLATPLTHKKLGPYSVPVRESEQVRCWGSSDTKGEKTYNTDQINCAMESELFVSEDLQTGSISMTHRFVQTNKLDPLRFAIFIGKMFSNRVNGNTKDENLTTGHCTEDFIGNNNFTSRAVVCVESYQKFSGLYNFLLFTSSTDEPLMNLQSRLVINGVSYENGQKLITQFLSVFSKENSVQKNEATITTSSSANTAKENN
ncbi:MAG: serine protease [Gammaproteobacteria bacterium]|nr:MAG: serine protease [Gammaproteobacteria bacterium]